MNGSRQLRAYLAARRSGQSTEAAASIAGFNAEEARLTDAAEARGELEHIDTKSGGNHVAEEFDPVVELATETLRGDARDAIISWFKAQPKAWPFLGEREQKDFAEAADRFSERLVKEACRLIAGAERPCIVAKLVEYKEKDGVEAKLKLPSKGEVVASLHEACGREVLLVCTGAEEHLGEQGPANTDPDQPDLPVMDGRYGPGND